MALAVRLSATGGPEVLQLEVVAQSTPKEGEVWLEHEAIGVNFLDVTQRSGDVPIKLPSGLGLEGVGTVAAVGPEVQNVTVGDRVGYALGPLGSYASGRLYPANRLVKIPASITSEQAAAVIFKGITAHYLIKSTYPVKPGTVVLLYGAAGAVGQILAPWANYLGARVIGVVAKQADIAPAKAAGCESVIVWSDSLPSEVERLTNGRKANVVYDGVGRKTFATSLDSLGTRGMLVSIGASTGAPPPVELGALNAKGSLFVTRPGLANHATDIAEYRERLNDVFDAVQKGIIKPTIGATFPLAEIIAAHTAYERGKAAGSLILKP